MIAMHGMQQKGSSGCIAALDSVLNGVDVSLNIRDVLALCGEVKWDTSHLIFQGSELRVSIHD